LITITRLLARQLRAVFRNSGVHSTSHSPMGPPVVFQAGPEGLRVRAHKYDVAVECHQPGELPADTIVVPRNFLDDAEGAKNEPVTLENGSNGHVVAQWRDKGTPQLLQYDSPATKDIAGFPDLPETFASNAPDLLAALADVGEVTDKESSRFVLGCLQLRGKRGSIVGSDGHQLLIHSGFAFPWDDDILVPANQVFGRLSQNQPVFIGRTNKWVTLRVETWTIFVAIDEEGKFPRNIDDVVPRANAAVSHCRFTAQDAKFLLQSVVQLPNRDEPDSGVTIDLNGKVCVRSRDPNNSEATEIVLTASKVEGEPVRVATNRYFLERALRLGLSELYLYGKDGKLFAFDSRRNYVWMPLESHSIVPPSPNPIRIEPQPDTPAAETLPIRTRRKPSVSKTTIAPATTETTPAISNVAATPASAEPVAKTAKNREPRTVAFVPPIEQAKALRASLKDTLLKTNDLIGALRRQQRQSKAVASTLASLKQLQKIA
jgi:hypothetical protein